jgi:hypothetical protein
VTGLFFERSPLADVSMLALCALFAWSASLGPVALAPIGVPRWEVIRAQSTQPQVPAEPVYIEDQRPALTFGAVVSRDTSAHFARGTFCTLTARLEVDDIKQAAERSTPKPCSVDISCGTQRALHVSYAECNVSPATGRAARNTPYVLSSQDEWGTCNHQTSFEIDGSRGRITIDRVNRENLSKPERETLELAVVGGVADL